MTEVIYHPEFEQQFKALSSSDPEVFAEVAALVVGLESYGHEIEGETRDDPSHPIVIADVDLFALRRNPETWLTPTIERRPPILRIPYVWMSRRGGEEYALVLFIGDKTDTGNNWYPAAKAMAEGDLIPRWEAQHKGHQARRRRR